MNKRLLIVFFLGFSSGLPLSLISSTLQAWFADAGMSIMATGALSLISFPYVYRALWGPILDRYALFSLGKRRSWMLLMQGLLLIGFNVMAWLTPTSSPMLMASLAILLACFSATQDASIDAHRTEYLPQSEHALGASLASFGFRLALLTTGGLALVMAQHMGWSWTYRLMGLLMIFGIVATIASPEPSRQTTYTSSLKESFLEPIKELISRPGILQLFIFIFMYKLGEVFTTTISGIVMPFLIQGIGFSLDTIGYVNKILGITSIVAGGLVAGYLLMRWSLYKALMLFGLMQAVTNLTFVALAIIGKNIPVFAIAVVSDNFAAGLGSTALVALFMRLVNQNFTATQFSIFVAIATIPRVISGPVAALLQSWLGWVGLYQLAFVLALGFAPFLILIRKHIPNENNPISKETIVIQANADLNADGS